MLWQDDGGLLYRVLRVTVVDQDMALLQDISGSLQGDTLISTSCQENRDMNFSQRKEENPAGSRKKLIDM